MLDLVPRSARRILDLGFGHGLRSTALKARGAGEVVGVEGVDQLALAAGKLLDSAGSSDPGAFSIQPGSFDIVLVNEVLEYQPNPASLLRQVRDWLQPGGQLLTRVAGIRRPAVIRGLLEGSWAPAPESAQAPLNGFTRREVEKLFYRAGFQIEERKIQPGPGHAAWKQRGRPGEVIAGNLCIRNLPVEEAEEFYASAHLIRAIPVPTTDCGLTSIIILTHNQLGYTRLCVDSLRPGDLRSGRGQAGVGGFASTGRRHQE